MQDSIVALITGGTRGIGASIALALKNLGFSVIITGRTHNENSELFAIDNGLHAVFWDLSSYSECQKNLSQIIKDYGKIDVLINSAGVVHDSSFHKMSHENWTKVIDTNLNSVFNTCNIVVPFMRQRRYGRIINIASVNAEKSQFGQANYAAAKAAVVRFTKTLAVELTAYGITANCISPGYIETDMTANLSLEIKNSIINQIPAGRFGRPEEIANVAAFLVSPQASFISGAVINVDGGQSCK